ncbi:phosphatidic acid phosphatase, partial [Crocinitomicaceae bacterium]|nr:phosphatidic acid phosphatase [Crocinitomicaceae bacterium]
EVMKSIFGDVLTFTDSTNFSRTDIDGTPRTYDSFTEMSEEISISRFYGGIHFLRTLNESLTYGRKIGEFVATELQCR